MVESWRDSIAEAGQLAQYWDLALHEIPAEPDLAPDAEDWVIENEPLVIIRNAVRCLLFSQFI